jgi:hypothetical protein
MKKWIVTALACLSLATLALPGAGRDLDRAEGSETNVFSLNALDYRLNIFDLRRNKPGFSRQVDASYREYLGDLFFNGEELIVLENDRYSGNFVPLGEEKRPDSEFNLFHSLRIYKRTFQVRQFPFLDRYLPYPAIEPGPFFGRIPEPRTSARLEIGHAYLLRLFHRTSVGEDRVFVLKVLELTPGVKVSVAWRELETSREP